jgi:hypothetical protein
MTERLPGRARSGERQVVDVEALRRHAGGDGRHVVFVDVERGWDPLHEDLVALDVAPPVSGLAWPDDRGHGTAVLGIVAAQGLFAGPEGIAPAPARVLVASTICATACRSPIPWERGTPDGDEAVRRRVADLVAAGVPLESTAEALRRAADAIGERPGIILLESQTHDADGREVPAEVEDDVRAAITGIVASGTPVVAAAGNGGVDLTDILPRTATGDSGSILVGGITSRPPHERTPDSNHGAAVDAWAHGDAVRTTWLNPTPDGRTSDAYGWLTGTSAAAAVIAGIAVCVQSIAVAHDQRMSPHALREAFRATACPLPDVERLLREHLDLPR